MTRCPHCNFIIHYSFLQPKAFFTPPRAYTELNFILVTLMDRLLKLNRAKKCFHALSIHSISPGAGPGQIDRTKASVKHFFALFPGATLISGRPTTTTSSSSSHAGHFYCTCVVGLQAVKYSDCNFVTDHRGDYPNLIRLCKQIS